MKKFLREIKHTLSWLWVWDDDDVLQSRILRTIVILAFMGLPLAFLLIFAILYWIVF